MNLNSPARFNITALTEIWTGDENRKNESLRETGLLGSLRWWCEALVRGLGGSACDIVNSGCNYDPDKKGQSGEIIPREQQICVICELFGCTGWSRKFRLRLFDQNGLLNRIKPAKGTRFIMELLWLRKQYEQEDYGQKDKEIWLITKSLEIAANYGSIGGKTVLIPPDKDYGLFEVAYSHELSCTCNDVMHYIKQYKQIPGMGEYPNLRRFFFSKGKCLDKNKIDKFFNDLPGTLRSFMNGRIGESKKIFSFQHGGGRLWGYTRNESELQTVINTINTLEKSGFSNLRTGREVIDGEL
ncbi:MAG: type III-B CRISPR module RAMP protein Cmr1 [Firmicutes bacterium]|nr:type III-B CRISPR module RAMP protein Cmr1 [Bacillota bacterium]